MVVEKKEEKEKVDGGKIVKKNNVWQIYEIHNDVMTTSSVARRDRLVVTTLRCGRSNPGSNPGYGIFFMFVTPASQAFFLRDP